MSLFIKRIVFVGVCIVIAATGVAFSLKAAVGIGAWDALSQSTSLVIGIKVGTFSMILNISCVLVQLLVLRKDFKPIYFLQIGMAILLGMVVNIVFYDVLASVVFTSYAIRMLVYVVSLFIIISAVSLIMSIDFLSLPLEAACQAVAIKTTISFAKLRQGIDFISIVLAIILSLAFSNPIPVREGTIIGMLIFGPMLGVFIPMFKPFVRRLGLIQ
jgi:uncharacterized membrane protein YczE